ncbi:Protein-lysine N-methyltransferase rrg1 [Neonectria punicea]|uniref:Protein-lysine N-methyltransferase rrg1 n=1 Tax=Neonectria punicea TaxID=979145 RepID=A0ABR1GTG0_9HYPO
MVGQNVYTAEQVQFLLKQIIDGKDGVVIAEEYQAAFGKQLSANQLRYVKNKYGKDPKYNTAMINTDMGRKRKRASDGPSRDKTKSPPALEVKKPKLEPPADAQVMAPNMAHGHDNFLWNIPQNPEAHMHMFQPQQQQLQAVMPPQVPQAVTYHQVPEVKSQLDFSQAIISPPMAPKNDPNGFQQGQGHMMNEGFSMQGPWENHQADLSNMGAMANLSAMQASSNRNGFWMPGAYPYLQPNASRPVQPQLPMGTQQQLAASSQYHTSVQQLRTRRPAGQPAPQYNQYMIAQPAEGHASLTNTPPIKTEPVTATYYDQSQQVNPVHNVGDMRQRALQNMGLQPAPTLGARDVKRSSSPQYYKSPQQQQQPHENAFVPFNAPSEPVPAASTAPVDEAAINATASPPPSSSKLQANKPAAQTHPSPMPPANVVSNQTLGSKMDHLANIDDVLTSGFDFPDMPFFYNDDEPNRLPPLKSPVVVLQQGFGPQTVSNSAPLALETIDPRLLGDWCSLPELKREDTTSPSEHGPKTPAVLDKFTDAV